MRGVAGALHSLTVAGAVAELLAVYVDDAMAIGLVHVRSWQAPAHATEVGP
ncbi:MAG: hypothetical protein QOJ11_2620 [Frankiales bacterium]|jgi:hypothetical protein|nr:hypothetical protein [Frankiales bacterium]